MCVIGDIAYIDLKDGIQQKYQVVEKFRGENSGTELTKNGELIANNCSSFNPSNLFSNYDQPAVIAAVFACR